MDVAECGQRQPAHGALTDLGEDGVAQLVEALRHHPGDPVGDDQANRHGDHEVAGCQGVDCLLVEERHVNVDELACEQERHRQHDPRAQSE